MLFDEQRLANLPIKPEYKERIRIICSKESTQQQCQILASTPDTELVEMFSQVENKLGQWKQNGNPPQLTTVKWFSCVATTTSAGPTGHGS